MTEQPAKVSLGKESLQEPVFSWLAFGVILFFSVGLYQHTRNPNFINQVFSSLFLFIATIWWFWWLIGLGWISARAGLKRRLKRQTQGNLTQGEEDQGLQGKVQQQFDHFKTMLNILAIELLLVSGLVVWQLDWVTNILKTGGDSKTDGLLRLLTAFLPLVLGGPFGLAVWHWRDQNKMEDIGNAQLDIETRDRNAREDRRLADIRELVAMQEKKPEVRVASLFLAKKYLMDSSDLTLQAATLELVKSVLYQWYEQPPKTDSADLPNPQPQTPKNQILAQKKEELALGIGLSDWVSFIPEVVKAAQKVALESHAQLQPGQLASLDLNYCWAPAANLQNAKLERANLRLAQLQWANLQGAELHGANLAGAELHGANLQGARLEGANLLVATLLVATLLGANLQEANLQGAHLQEAHLQEARYSVASPGSSGTKFPRNFGDPRKRGMICVDDEGNPTNDPTVYPEEPAEGPEE